MTEPTLSPDIIETSQLRGKVKLLQPRDGFHASTDAVLLAAAAPLENALHVLDVGCGVGAVGLNVTLRKNSIYLTGIDIQEEMIDLAIRNAALNGIADRCTFVAADLMGADVLPDNHYDLIVSNPPFQAEGRHPPSPHAAKALAHGEDASGVTLNKWIKYLHKKAKQGAHVVVIHRADRLDEITRAMTERRWFGSLVVQPVHSRQGDPAKRVIVLARKERYAPLVLKAGLVMHNTDGSYTDEAAKILAGDGFLLLKQ